MAGRGVREESATVAGQSVQGESEPMAGPRVKDDSEKRYDWSHEEWAVNVNLKTADDFEEWLNRETKYYIRANAGFYGQCVIVRAKLQVTSSSATWITTRAVSALVQRRGAVQTRHRRASEGPSPDQVGWVGVDDPEER